MFKVTTSVQGKNTYFKNIFIYKYLIHSKADLLCTVHGSSDFFIDFDSCFVCVFYSNDLLTSTTHGLTHLFDTVDFHIRIIFQPLSLLAIGSFGSFFYVAMTTIANDTQNGRNQC